MKKNIRNLLSLCAVSSIFLLTNHSVQAAEKASQLYPLEKMVVTDQMNNIRRYKDSKFDSYKTEKPGVAFKVDGYRKYNGKIYYRIYRTEYCGYIDASQVNNLVKKKDKRLVTATSSNYTRYSNLFFKKRGMISKGTTYEVDGHYDLGSKRYVSLYRYNSKGERGWYGYVNEDAIKNMTLYKQEKYVVISNPNYKRYSNFFWKYRGKADKGVIYKTSGYYKDGNGNIYYSLYRNNSSGKRGWYGYINKKALKFGSWSHKKVSFKVKNSNYKGYKHPYLAQVQSHLSNYKGKKLTSSTYFDTGDGRRYYALYYGSKQLGLVNDDALQSDYYRTNPKIIRVIKGTNQYSDYQLKHKKSSAPKDEYYKVSECVWNTNGYPRLKLSNGNYITANSSYVRKTNGYQNPKEYYQVQYNQIKPYGTVGYNLGWGYMGVKSYMVMSKLGVYNGYNFMGDAQINAVKNFQRRHGLKANGWVDKKTWMKLGFSEQSWTSIDSYVAPLKAFAWDGRKKHIEAMISQAYKYKGNKYLEGASSSPSYGVDCSGLVMQALYAGGINPAPISSINHAHPGNEYNSRNLWASKQLKRVPYSERQRGDLIFYYQPGTHTIWHVAIYLGNDQVIESWPPKVTVWPIRNAQRNVIAGVKRPFI